MGDAAVPPRHTSVCGELRLISPRSRPMCSDLRRSSIRRGVIRLHDGIDQVIVEVIVFRNAAAVYLSVVSRRRRFRRKYRPSTMISSDRRPWARRTTSTADAARLSAEMPLRLSCKLETIFIYIDRLRVGSARSITCADFILVEDTDWRTALITAQIGLVVRSITALLCLRRGAALRACDVAATWESALSYFAARQRAFLAIREIVPAHIDECLAAFSQMFRNDFSLMLPSLKVSLHRNRARIDIAVRGDVGQEASAFAGARHIDQRKGES